MDVRMRTERDRNWASLRPQGFIWPAECWDEADTRGSSAAGLQEVLESICEW